tara:strand:+ start:871 stop:1119 length:249 start_codon:yes stop_codon:yes gene_type:complete
MTDRIDKFGTALGFGFALAVVIGFAGLIVWLLGMGAYHSWTWSLFAIIPVVIIFSVATLYAYGPGILWNRKRAKEPSPHVES